jgi:phosphatidylserine/phosphatidylglycerophosphate/cardiolipin synthase-like enzyme
MGKLVVAAVRAWTPLFASGQQSTARSMAHATLMGISRFAAVLTVSSSEAAVRPLPLDAARNCWQVAKADRAAFIVDAEDYYRIARKAMMSARSRILIIGWDVDTRICLDQDANDEAPECLGPLLSWLVKTRPELEIYVLAWDGAAYKFLGRGSTIFRLVTWARHRRVHFRLDSTHPGEASHHQKILVIDDSLAFCGGIDMTGSRWDTREHKDDDPRRRRPTTGRRYGPWHDSTMAVDGAAAKALGDLGRLRWKIGCNEEIPEAEAPPKAPWPDGLKAGFRNVQVAIARTRGKVENWTEVREIEALYVDMIMAAERFVYIENQYFASRAVAAAVSRRLKETGGPEFLLISPRAGMGWLDDEAMSPARAELMKALAEVDHEGRFRIFNPVTTCGDEIYVHSKVTIVDDRMLRVGSANLNNRSMGLDSECDVMIDAARHEGPAVGDRIAAIRTDLMAEHLGVSPEEVERSFRATGSLIKTVEALRGPGRTLEPFVPEEPNALEKTLAQSHSLDPESADEKFEPMARHRLFKGIRRRR